MEFTDAMIFPSPSIESEPAWKRTLKDWVIQAETYLAVSDKLRELMGQVFKNRQQLQQHEVKHLKVKNICFNVYFAGDAYAPKHWPSQVVQFANTYGQDKFLFATDWPVIEPERAIKEINDQSYRPESYKKIMRNNALKIFNITGTGLNTCPKDWATLLPGDSLKKLLNS